MSRSSTEVKPLPPSSARNSKDPGMVRAECSITAKGKVNLRPAMNELDAFREQGSGGDSVTAAREPGKLYWEKSISTSPLGSCTPLQLRSQEP